MSGGSLWAGTCRLTNGSPRRAGSSGPRPASSNARGHPPAPVLGAERVAQLPQVGAPPSPRRPARTATAAGRRPCPRSAEAARHRPLQNERQVGDEQEQARPQHRCARRVPPAGHRQPGSAHRPKTTSATTAVRSVRRAATAPRNRPPRRARRAEQGQRQPASRRPGPTTRAAVPGHEQGRRAERCGDEADEQQRREHDPALPRRTPREPGGDVTGTEQLAAAGG